MKKNLPTFVFILVLLLVGAGIYFLNGSRGANGDLVGFKDVSLPDTSESATSSTDVPKALAESTPPTTQVTDSLRRYQNSKFRFGLLYPKELSVREYTEQGGALTVTFASETAAESFQVYVTPYDGKQITTERFKTDEPSGVYQQPTDVVVGGVRATMFFGSNAVMGDTREVWFIRNGYLYEVTTYKELDSWLGGVMKTWTFL